MSGLMTISARLSNGKIISGKTLKGDYIGAKTITDEKYFLFILDDYLELPEERLLSDDLDDALAKHKEYEKGVSLIAPYHYGFCFIDYIDKTVDYYNIDNRLLIIHKLLIQEVIKQMFSKYHEQFEEANKNNSIGKTIIDVLRNDSSQVEFTNFLHAKNNGWLKEFKDGQYEKITFEWVDFLNYCLNGQSKSTFPNVFYLEIPEWKINFNRHDISLTEFKKIKDNMIGKNILNDMDLKAWEEYEKEMFPEKKLIDDSNTKWNDNWIDDEIFLNEMLVDIEDDFEDKK